MADEKLRWNELPVNVRRSKHLLYNYLAFGELPSMPETVEETVEEPAEEPAATTVNIGVTVTDGSDPVSGVAVAIGDINGTTGGQGGCTLSNVPVGSATVTATKEGFEDYSQSILVTGETTSLEIELTEL